MNKYIGIKIINQNPNGVIEFSILQTEKAKAIETLLNCIKDGHIVTLSDNRDNRCGSISLKYTERDFYRSGGGHGFSLDWEKISEKDATWYIKSLAIFNTGEDDYSIGTIK